MVGEKGLEPLRIATLDPKSSKASVLHFFISQRALASQDAQ